MYSTLLENKRVSRDTGEEVSGSGGPWETATVSETVAGTADDVCGGGRAVQPTICSY
jgi:hypothetical protein